jgi:hypothetical protein
MKATIKEVEQSNFKPFDLTIRIKSQEQAQVLMKLFGKTTEKDNPGCYEIYDVLSDHLEKNYE